jgi:hypothetical protein
MSDSTEHGTRFATLPDWVSQWFLPTWQHRLGPAQVWCRQWWQHAEAISRLEAMWRSWEASRLDGAMGLAMWWRDVADYQMHQLLDSHGPFAACRDTHTDDNRLFLRADPPPPGWFDAYTDQPAAEPAWQ